MTFDNSKREMLGVIQLLSREWKIQSDEQVQNSWDGETKKHKKSPMIASTEGCGQIPI